MTLQKTQLALIEEGFFLGTSGPSGKGDDGVLSTYTRRALEAYQRLHHLPITGEDDEPTRRALFDDEKPEPPAEPVYALEPSWLPDAADRILVGCTGGRDETTDADGEAFHVIVQPDGSLVRGDGVPTGADGKGDLITVMAACTADTMLREQWDRLAAVVAEICGRRELPITPKTVFSRAEAPEDFPGAEDIARFAFDPSVTGAKACGDALRARAIELRLDGR